MKSVFSALLVLMLFMPASATIINVPGDQPNIQAGIDASSHDDTVRVESSTYVENIDFSGKNIVVGSWFLDDGDPSYISSTIIDGGASGSVVTFENGEDNTAVIIGFTIQNGITQEGGGIICRLNSSPTISNNTISGNSASVYGGGISCIYSNPTISNNTISGNSATILGGGGISCDYDSSPTINYNTIIGNSSIAGGGIICWDNSSPTINYNTITGNSSDAGGGIYCWDNSSPTISNNTISENSATAYGGGIFCRLNSSPTISNNTINGNSADRGGGICCTSNSNPAINNNTINRNSADRGGGIHCYNSSPTISNNTISGNSGGWYGGGIYCYNSSSVITNTILWGDTAPTDPEIYLSGPSSPVITYCDVQGGWAGEGNIDCDPEFCDPDNDNFYLDAGSCCLGAGEGGADIGAFGVGCGEEIPTLSEWGMIIMALLLLTAGTIAVIRRRKAAMARTN